VLSSWKLTRVQCFPLSCCILAPKNGLWNILRLYIPQPFQTPKGKNICWLYTPNRRCILYLTTSTNDQHLVLPLAIRDLPSILSTMIYHSISLPGPTAMAYQPVLLPRLTVNTHYQGLLTNIITKATAIPASDIEKRYRGLERFIVVASHYCLRNTNQSSRMEMKRWSAIIFVISCPL
jgi:hypothetical protein